MKTTLGKSTSQIRHYGSEIVLLKQYPKKNIHSITPKSRFCIAAGMTPHSPLLIALNTSNNILHHPLKPDADLNSTPDQSQKLITSRRQFITTSSTLLLASSLFTTALSPVSSAHASYDKPGTPRQLTPEEATALEKAFSKTMTKGKSPVMLRLVFHDAGTYDLAANNGGINASIRFELGRPENTGLKRGYRVIEQTVEALKGTAAEHLSKADLIALAGARAVRITGGPEIRNVPVGRIDAEEEDPQGRLPGETLSAPEQVEIFKSKGITAKEMMILVGSHTLGTKGYGDPLTFDNGYYSTLLKKPWLNMNDEMGSMIGIPTDHVLPDDPICRPFIEMYARDKDLFYRDFDEAYVHLSMLGAKWS